MNDLVLTLLGTCEFWLVGAAGGIALVVYIFLNKIGVPGKLAGLIAIGVSLYVGFMLYMMVCA